SKTWGAPASTRITPWKPLRTEGGHGLHFQLVPRAGRRAFQTVVRPSLVLEEHRRELRQVVAPVEPGVAAVGLLVGHVELVLLEHVDGRLRGLDQEVLLAAPEPDELQAVLERCVVERGLVRVFPLGAGSRAPEAAG